MKTKTSRRRAAVWIALTAMLLSALVPIAASADDVGSAVSEGTCNGLGYEKPDELDDLEGKTGSFQVRDDGTLVATIYWNGNTVSVDVEPGYELDLCVKSGSDRPIYEVLELTSADNTFVDVGTQEVSHIGYLWRRLPTEEPELELLKVWQDEDGTPMSPVSGVDWSASVLYGNGDETYIEIGGTIVSDTGVFESGRTHYLVVEEGEGFSEVACSEATMQRVEAAYAGDRMVDYSGTNDGVALAAPTADTLHVICNTPDEPDFYIDVDKVVTGNTASSTAEFDICVETFPYQEPVVNDVSNGQLVPPAYLQCETFRHGDEFRFGELWPGEFRVWESSAVPVPQSVGYGGDGVPAPTGFDGVIVELTETIPTASVTVTNNYPDFRTQTLNYYLDFEKEWSLDTVGGRLSDLDTDGYNASFDVVSLEDEVVTVDVDDVTLSAGGQSVVVNGRRSVLLNRDYLLEESFAPLGDDLPCIIETTFSYDGEVLDANSAGEVIFTTPTIAANGTTFTIDVENEVVCDAVLEEVVETVEVEAAKSWYRTSTAGLVELDAAPAGAEPSYQVVVKGPGAENVLVDELDAGDALTIPELEDGETYLMTWEEIDPLAEFELGDAACTWSEEDSTYFGSATFVAGEVDTVSFTGVNAYDCLEVKDAVIVAPAAPTALPQTGAPALWLTFLGLLGMGLGGGLLGRRRER